MTSNKTSFPKDMDKECIPLCQEINDIPGLKTNESCSGHGRHPMFITLTHKTVKERTFIILMRALSERYGCPLGWKVEIKDTDLPEKPFYILITSTSIGEKAYKEADIIVKNIIHAKNHKAFVNAFVI